jgi:hypothetical protein
VIKPLVAMKQLRLICCEALMKAVKSTSKEKTMTTVKVKEKNRIKFSTVLVFAFPIA